MWKKRQNQQRVVILHDWPQPTTVAEPRVWADDHKLAVTYSTNEERYAVIRFASCRYFAFGAPNDEALGGHPLAAAGLKYYSVHEIHGSALIRQLERQNSAHPKHSPDLFRDLRHLVFTFQDSTLECVVDAGQWSPPPDLTVYKTLSEAEAAWRWPEPNAASIA